MCSTCVCIFEFVCVQSCVFTFAFARGPAWDGARCRLTRASTDKSPSIEWFWYAVFDYFNWSIWRLRRSLEAQFTQAIRTFTCMILCVPGECKNTFCCRAVCTNFFKKTGDVGVLNHVLQSLRNEAEKWVFTVFFALPEWQNEVSGITWLSSLEAEFSSAHRVLQALPTDGLAEYNPLPDWCGFSTS